jgi:Zn finger protein HypA/HybF involved in hydrogenase expression
MPDPYWEKVGRELRDKPKTCFCYRCGQAVESVHNDSSRGICPACLKKEPRAEKAPCVTCGEIFLTNGYRKRCPDCVGEKPEQRDPNPGTRLGGLGDGRP